MSGTITLTTYSLAELRELSDRAFERACQTLTEWMSQDSVDDATEQANQDLASIVGDTVKTYEWDHYWGELTIRGSFDVAELPARSVETHGDTIGGFPAFPFPADVVESVTLSASRNEQSVSLTYGEAETDREPGECTLAEWDAFEADRRERIDGPVTEWVEALRWLALQTIGDVLSGNEDPDYLIETDDANGWEWLADGRPAPRV